MNWAKTASLAFLLLAAQACREKKEDPIADRFGYEFFPLEVGKAWEYDVQKITWVALDPDGDTSNYEIREQVTEKFVDLSGREAYRIERSIRVDSNAAWVLDSIIIANRGTTQALRTENNQTYVRLIFPLKAESEWNGNIYNTLGTETYRIAVFDTAWSNGHKGFGQCLRVLQKNIPENCVDKNVRFETYCAGVGLVEKSDENLIYRQGNVFCQGIIESGYIYRQRLKRTE